VSLHGKQVLGKNDKKGWHYDKILLHLQNFGPKKIMTKKFHHTFLNAHFFSFLFPFCKAFLATSHSSSHAFNSNNNTWR